MSKVNTSPGRIAYRDEVVFQSNVYSIDKLRVRIPLLWSSLHYRNEKGIELSLSDKRVIAGVCDILFRGGLKSVVDSSRGRYIACWKCFDFPGFLYLQKFKPFHSEVDYYSCILEFNPNKINDLSGPAAIINAFKKAFGDRFMWDCLRCDYAFDVPGNISDYRLLSRKNSSSYLGTYYFGVRGTSGYTRVYDKRLEYIKHYGIDIQTEITRFEWESILQVPFVFDTPYRIGNLYNHDVLRFVSMEFWNDALRTFDPKTAKKIKENALIKVPFDPSIYDELYHRLIVGLGLTADTIHHQLSKQSAEAEEEYLNMVRDIDLISAELNRWAKDPDLL